MTLKFCTDATFVTNIPAESVANDWSLDNPEWVKVVVGKLLWASRELTGSGTIQLVLVLGNTGS